MKVITAHEGTGVVVLVCSKQMANVKCGAAVSRNGEIEWQARHVNEALEGTVNGVADFHGGQNLGNI